MTSLDATELPAATSPFWIFTVDKELVDGPEMTKVSRSSLICKLSKNICSFLTASYAQRS